MSCDPADVALKSLFLGPQAENAPWVSDMLLDVFRNWVAWRRSLYPEDGVAISESDQISEDFKCRQDVFRESLTELMRRFESEVPKFSPRYIGHMFSEISLPALMGHIVTLLHNPNNISGESSRVGVQIEQEAIQALGRMIGFDPEGTDGHFTSGGTVANFEALIRARARVGLWMSADAAAKSLGKIQDFSSFRSAHMGWSAFESRALAMSRDGLKDAELAHWNPSLSNPWEYCARIELLTKKPYAGPVVLVPENMHYSWKKGAYLLGLGEDALWPIPLSRDGRCSVSALGELIERAESLDRPIALVASVVGSTELGSIDPVNEVQELLDDIRESKGVHIWHHVDAAYGGFFCSIDPKRESVLEPRVFKALRAVSRVESVTLDPHKLGYVPYASGAILLRERKNYAFQSSRDAPYIDFDLKRDRGPYTLEGSRSAAGAVATWMTSRTAGLDGNGYGRILERTVRIRRDLERKLLASGLPVRIAPGGDTNILCFACAREGDSLSVANQRTLRVYNDFSSAENGAFIVSKTALHWKSYSAYLDDWTRSWSASRDADEVFLVRLCLMNPFFESVVSSVNYAEEFLGCLRKSL